jgi:hypothetical protein
MTLDVDLVTLRSCGIVRILIGMMNPKALEKQADVTGLYIGVGVVVKLKFFEFLFHREAADFIPDLAFVPYFWRRKEDDVDDEDGGKEKHLEGSMGQSG